MEAFNKFFMKQTMLCLEAREDWDQVPAPSSQLEPLDEYLQRLEGITVQQILNYSTFQGLYFGNKHGIGGPEDGFDKAMEDFTASLVVFVNRDAQGVGPSGFRPRVYDTEEFKQQHNYAEYTELDQQARRAMRDKMTARQKGTDQDLQQAEAEYNRLRHLQYNTEYWNAYQKAKQEEDEYVKNMHNTPMSREKLSDDGSKTYKRLQLAYDGLLQYL